MSFSESGVNHPPALGSNIFPKYGSYSIHAATLLPELVNSDMFSLISASLSLSSWKRIVCAHRSLSEFAAFDSAILSWPISPNLLHRYIDWAFRVKKLKSSTISSYISAFKSIHNLKHLDSSVFSSSFVKSLIRGAENLEIYSQLARSSRRVFTLQALKILGHNLASSGWPKDWIKVVWAASCCAFFGSLRLGEILPCSESKFLKQEVLLWRDVFFSGKGHIILHIKCSKSRTKGGESVDIFSFPGHGCCPVKALLGLKNSHPPSLSMDQPVFMSSSGTVLTTAKLNKIIRSMLSLSLGDHGSLFSCHSFRAAIPAVLAQHPDIASSDMIMGWGRWKSSAYMSYTRLKSAQRKLVFSKIADILNSP